MRIKKKCCNFAALFRAAYAYMRVHQSEMVKNIAFILYNTPEYSEKVQVVVKEETLWMTQKAMGELFGCSSDNIGLHLKNIFEGGELDKNSVTEKISATAADGKNYLTQFYNLDAIIC